MDETDQQLEDGGLSLGLLSPFWKNVLIWIIVVLVLVNVLRLVAKKVVFGDAYYSITEYKNDTVYLFTFPRNYTRQLLNLSPYAVKLESWLRLKKVKYELVETNQFSKATRQMPYVLFNGVEYVDTLLIIDQLTSLLDLPPDDLTPEQEGISRAFIRMVDEGLAMSHFLFRYCYIKNKFFGRLFRPNEKLWVTAIFKYFFNKGVSKRGRLSGIGRHSQTVVGDVGKDDLRSISRYLGSKKFMFGDEINLVDCSIFGQLSHIIYIDLDLPHKTILDTECTNIKPYVERVKNTLWKDWDEIVNPKPFE